MSEEIFKTIVDRDILQQVITDSKGANHVRAMCIWGSFTDEVPGIHLGHLHMMNNLWELGENGIRISICINDEPILNPPNKDRESLIRRHAGITASILHVL